MQSQQFPEFHLAVNVSQSAACGGDGFAVGVANTSSTTSSVDVGVQWEWRWVQASSGVSGGAVRHGAASGPQSGLLQLVSADTQQQQQQQQQQQPPLCVSVTAAGGVGAALQVSPCDAGSVFKLDALGRLALAASGDAMLCMQAAAPSATAAATPGTLVFFDDFTAPTLDTNAWQVLEQVHRGGVYTAANVVVANGTLQLVSKPFDPPLRLPDNRTFFMSSGAVNTSMRLEALWGRWEVRARLPDVDATAGWTGHNSFWLYNSGHQEVDVFEQTADVAGAPNSTAAGNVHAWHCPSRDECGSAPCTLACSGDKCTPGGQFPLYGAWQDAFHVFSIDMRPDAITWAVDGAVTNVVTNATVIGLYNRPLFAALTACVMEDVPAQPGDVFPQTFVVDWVKLYA